MVFQVNLKDLSRGGAALSAEFRAGDTHVPGAIMPVPLTAAARSSPARPWGSTCSSNHIAK
jgi:hypothetical protein